MGLDISVGTTVKEVLEAYELEDQPEVARLFKAACEKMGLKPEDRVHTRPGSYAGLHRVRTAYAKLKGVDTGENHTDWQRRDVLGDSHLVRHSDCDGWYLPNDFEDPLWSGEFSVGSSVKLLKELREIDPEKLEEYDRRSWDAVFVAAVASVYGNEPIHFG